MSKHPRLIDPQRSFNDVVEWLYNDIIIQRGCPGIIVGLSGTDSIVSFLAAYKAFEKAGKPHRLLGVHFAPSEDFLYDHPEAETHLWFRNAIVPWLKSVAPEATILVDDSIDWRYDGLRWGKLMDMSVIFIIDRAGNKRIMRKPEDQYWLCGTRNRTEDVMKNYSNASTIASIQPIIHLWKNEVLQISKHLGVPQLAIEKSCEVDCICGRERMPAKHPRELDLVLMAEIIGEIDRSYLETSMPNDLRKQLHAHIMDERVKHWFKESIPYRSDVSGLDGKADELVWLFEDGGLDLSQFNHRKHLYVAWCYLNAMPFDEALNRYAHYLNHLLKAREQGHRFNLEITRSYFERLDKAMKVYSNIGFDELIEKAPYLLRKG